MSCVCGSNRIFEIDAKCSDMCTASFKNAESNGYVPRELGIGGGDYIRMHICAECARIQNFQPLTENQVIAAIRGEEVDQSRFEQGNYDDWDE